MRVGVGCDGPVLPPTKLFLLLLLLLLLTGVLDPVPIPPPAPPVICIVGESLEPFGVSRTGINKLRGFGEPEPDMPLPVFPVIKLRKAPLGPLPLPDSCRTLLLLTLPIYNSQMNIVSCQGTCAQAPPRSHVHERTLLVKTSKTASSRVYP